jgi:hypothetical protein
MIWKYFKIYLGHYLIIIKKINAFVISNCWIFIVFVKTLLQKTPNKLISGNKMLYYALAIFNGQCSLENSQKIFIKKCIFETRTSSRDQFTNEDRLNKMQLPNGPFKDHLTTI